MIDLNILTIKKAQEMMEKGEITSESLTQSYLDEIAKKNPKLNAYLEVFDDAIEQAKEADKRRMAGEKGELLGIPIAVKDNILIKGRKVGAASKILEGYIATYDATAIQKLKEAGVVFLGRTNMDEFAMGASTENSAYGVTKNPFDDSKVAGGSSGGSASVVGGNIALAAIGSDTGGSIRQPAGFCGAVGMKPSYGGVSRYGLIAMGSSLDQIGPITKSVEDAKIIFDCIKGKDKHDSTSVEILDSKNKKKKIGIPRGIAEMKGLEENVKENFLESIEIFKKAGYEIIDVDLPMLSYALAVYYILMPAEVSSNMARFDGVRFGKKIEGDTVNDDYMKTRGELLGKEVRRRILLGTYVLSAGYYDAYYGKANTVRNLIKKDFDKAFEVVDVVLTPTSPTPAFSIGEKTNDPLEMYLADIFTVTANLIGSPALALPSGFTKSEKPLPLSVQITAPYLNDQVLFEIGKDFESSRQK